MPEDKRLRHVLRTTLETPDVKALQKRLARIYRSANIGLEGDCAFIIGETGAGKTAAAPVFDGEFAGLVDQLHDLPDIAAGRLVNAQRHVRVR